MRTGSGFGEASTCSLKARFASTAGSKSESKIGLIRGAVRGGTKSACRFVSQQPEHDCVLGLTIQVKALPQDAFPLRSDFLGHALAGSIADGYHNFKTSQLKFAKTKFTE